MNHAGRGGLSTKPLAIEYALQQNPFLVSGGIQDRAIGGVKFAACWYNPNNTNRYACAGNDPIDNIDPTGGGIWLDCEAAIVGDLIIANLTTVELVSISLSAATAPVNAEGSLARAAAVTIPAAMALGAGRWALG